MTVGAKCTRFIAAGLASLVMLGCGKPDNPNDYPVSHWLKDGEDCTRASAAAIIKAGLPFPNFGSEGAPSAASGVAPERRIKTVDMWLGPTRFVIPAQVASSNGAYPATHPRRYQGLRGSLPNFYPVGPAAPVKDGMGPMVEVNFKCSMDEKYAASWGRGYQSNEEGIERVKAQYEADAAQFDVKRVGPSRISVNRREDIRMIEVLYERGGAKYNDGMPMWEASYWPLDKPLTSPDGAVGGIGCARRHDPVERRYGQRGWRCGSGIRLTPYGGAQIEVYVSHIEQMPAVFEQVKQLLISAQQPVKE